MDGVDGVAAVEGRERELVQPEWHSATTGAAVAAAVVAFGCDVAKGAVRLQQKAGYVAAAVVVAAAAVIVAEPAAGLAPRCRLE